MSNQKALLSSVVGWRVLQHARLAGVDAATMTPVREVVGSGLKLAEDPAKGGFVVTGTYPGSPGEAARLPAGTVIYAIGETAMAGKTLVECAALIRGKAGTAVTLTVAGPGESERRRVELVRGAYFIGQ